MAIEDLLTALEQEARERVAERLAEAQAEAGKIASEAEARVAARRAEFVATREGGLRVAAELELVDARRDGRRLVLDARADMLQAVREAAETRLPQVEADPRYRALLPLQLAEALRYVGDQECVVRSSSWLEPILAAAARGRAGARARTEEADTGGGGFVVVGADGSVRVEMTLRGILDRLWPEIAMAIIARVEGAAKDTGAADTPAWPDRVASGGVAPAGHGAAEGGAG